MDMKCPTVESVIEANKRLIKLKKIAKAEKHELIKPRVALEKTIKDACSEKDIYDGAASLLENINRGHFFGSANKRTAYVTALDYLKSNDKKIIRKPRNEETRILSEIRQGKISRKEIKRWLKA